MGDHVDDAADGVAAVEERGGAADDLDAFDEKRFDAHGVIGAGDGGVEGADAVFEEADAVTAETPNDRAAGAGTEGGGVNAGLGGERFAERGLLFQL